MDPSMKRDREIESCSQCEGQWIPGRLINPLLGAGQKKVLRGMCKEHRTTLTCPYDGALLGEVKIRGVVVDFCPNCNGVWLDPGELEHLRKGPKVRRKRQRSFAEIGGRKAIFSAGEIALGALLEGIAWLLFGG